MNKNSSSASSYGIKFLDLLAIAFIVLKLLGKITWKWVWVLCPLWAGLALALVILLISLIIAIFKK